MDSAVVLVFCALTLTALYGGVGALVFIWVVVLVVVVVVVIVVVVVVVVVYS